MPPPEERELGTPRITAPFAAPQAETFTQVQVQGMRDLNSEMGRYTQAWERLEQRVTGFFTKAKQQMGDLVVNAGRVAGGTNSGGGHGNYAFANQHSAAGGGFGGFRGGGGAGGNGGNWVNSSSGDAGEPGPLRRGLQSARSTIGRGVDIFTFRNGNGAEDDIRYLAARQATSQLAGYASAVAQRYESSAAQFGITRSYLTQQTARFTGQGYGATSRGPVQGYERGVTYGWRDPNELYGGIAQGQLRLRNFNRSQAQQIGVLSALGPQLGGFGGAESFVEQLQSPQMQAQLAPYGAGMFTAGGGTRSLGGTFASLQQVITGQAGGAFGQGALSARSLKATFNTGGIGRANLAARGFTPEQIDVIGQYYQASAQHGRALDLNSADAKALGIDSGFARSSEKRSEALGRARAASFMSAEDTMSAVNDEMSKFYGLLQQVNKQIGPLGYGFGMVGKAAGGLINVLAAVGGLRSIMGMLGVGGAAAEGAGTGALTMAGANSMFAGGTLAATGAGLMSGGIALAGGFLAGKAGAAVGGRLSHGNRLAKIGGGAASGAALGAGLGLLGGPLAPLSSTAGAVIGGLAGGAAGLFGDPVMGGRFVSYRRPPSTLGVDIGDGPLPGGGATKGLDPTFLGRLEKMFTENPKLQLNSGFRSYQDQANLYKNRGSNKYPVAKPGTSRHEQGIAADLGPPSELGWVRANAGRFGLTVPMPDKDPVHVELGGGGSGPPRSANTIEEPPDAIFGGGADSGRANRYYGTQATVLAQIFSAGKLPTTAGFAASGAAVAAGAQTGGMDTGADATSGTGTMSAAQLVKLARGAGFSGSGLRTAVAVALAESGGNPAARHANSDKYHSIDRGLWEINSYWHKEVSDSAAFNPTQNAAAAFRISNQGRDWGAWSTYNNGAYKRELGAVDAALSGGAGDAVMGDSGNHFHISSLALHVQIDKVSQPEVDRLFSMFQQKLQKEAAHTKMAGV